MTCQFSIGNCRIPFFQQKPKRKGQAAHEAIMHVRLDLDEAGSELLPASQWFTMIGIRQVIHRDLGKLRLRAVDAIPQESISINVFESILIPDHPLNEPIGDRQGDDP
jgi:hypothetical protein